MFPIDIELYIIPRSTASIYIITDYCLGSPAPETTVIVIHVFLFYYCLFIAGVDETVVDELLESVAVVVAANSLSFCHPVDPHL
jgi:hypothetical protein